MKELVDSLEALANAAVLAMLIICVGVVIYIKVRGK